MRLTTLFEDSPFKRLVHNVVDWLYGELEKRGHKPDGILKLEESGAILYALEANYWKKVTRALRISVSAQKLPFIQYSYDIRNKEDGSGHEVETQGMLNIDDPAVMRKIITLAHKYR